MAIRMTVDVSELQSGDVIIGEEEMGPVKSHRPNINFPDAQEMVYWMHGGYRDVFGKPQRLEILRTPSVSEEFAAELEKRQAQKDYRASWAEDTANWTLERENSAWEYTNSSYRAWAHETNK